MMPLSFAGLISGMMTLVATAPNLVVNAELIRSGEKGFGFFSFTPIGVPIIVAAILYMLIVGGWLLKGNEADSGNGDAIRPSLADWVKKYDLKTREHIACVLPGSKLIGESLEKLQLRNSAGASILVIQRDYKLLQPTPKTKIELGDVLLVDLHLPDVRIQQLVDELRLELRPLSGFYFSEQSQDIGLVEVIIPDGSDLVGHSLIESRFRGRTGLTVVGIRRGTTRKSGYAKEDALQIGDTLLLVGPWRAIRNVHQSIGVVPLSLPREHDDVLPAPRKAAQAIACLLLTVGLMVSGVVANVHAAFIGCLLMGLLGCINFESSYRSIDWKTLMLIVGMLPFSMALQRTGAIDIASNAFMSATAGGGTYVLLGALFAMTAVCGMFISNTATAVLMAPVALQIASKLDASPYPFAMTVAIAASTAFMTPVSSPVNTLVVTPGNYSFSDFVKVGVPFSLIVMLIAVGLIPILFPL